MDERIRLELNRRRAMYEELARSYPGLTGIPPQLLRDLRIYGGYQGIYYDKANTSTLVGGAGGVTVSILHTGRHYPDDLSDTHIIYHYPETSRSGHDMAEVSATKNAGRLEIPIFVVAYSSQDETLRDVSVGIIQEWHDEAAIFLIALSKEWVEPTSQRLGRADGLPRFELTTPRRSREVSRRERSNNQPLFKFSVLRRYGSKCAVCYVSRVEMLQAAHIRPVSENGSDDPRNGLVLCVNHHLAFDANLFAFDPETLEVVYKPSGVTGVDLGITNESLRHLKNKPHPDALMWRHTYWKRNVGLSN